jgi:hypothetical protein
MRMILTTTCPLETHYSVGMNIFELTIFLALIFTYCQSLVS